MIIALMIEQVLAELGCDIVGPIGKLSLAVATAQEQAIDAAILDVNIRGGVIFPVAEILEGRGIPFVFSSGYGDWALPEAFREQRRLTKPFTVEELEARVRDLCGL